MVHKILVVDDSKEIRDILSTCLTEMGNEVTAAESGIQAIEYFSKELFSLVLCDIVMPGGIDGIQTLTEIKKLKPEQPVVMVSGMGTHELIIKSIELGAADFVPKPINLAQINKIVNTYINAGKIKPGESGPLGHPAGGSAITHLLRENYLYLLNTLNSILEARDPYLKGHAERVAKFAVMIANAIKLAPEAIEVINCAAQIHDIGKIGVSDAVLMKTDKLNEAEWVQMKTHPVIGCNIIEQQKLFRSEEPLIRHHHERYDGGGYPDGLKKEAIPFGARIIAIADTYDAMTSTRPYRGAMDEAKAKKIIGECIGTQFDPYLAKTFLGIV